MKQIWSLTAGEYLEIIEIAKADGVKPGESIEPYFLAYMKLKNKKPIGNTELTKEELIREYVSKGKTVLSSDEDGYKITKKKEQE